MAGLLNNMSNEEQDIFAQVLQETRQKKKDLSQSKQIREIVPIEKWISSPYYVGRDGAKLYDFWKEEMIDIFGENRGKYNEIVVTGCFIGSTEVPLLNGEIKTMEELADEYGFSKEFWVYSTDDEGNIVPGKARNARKTGKNKEVWYVELDNGEKVYCTPDHKFRIKNGNYKQAKELRENDNLMKSNHKVVNVGFSHYEDVYDFEVDKYHNFMIEPGINVHNSLGTGKSTFALFCMLRKLYELSCYENIAGLFDLMSTSFIVFIYFSVNRTQAELTGFGQFRELVDSIDYFQKEFARNEKLNSLLKFPENVLFTHGSSTEHAIGMNMIGAILDEANFFKGEERNPSKSTNQAYSQIAELYSSIVNRGKSRFMDKDEDHSLSILVSSATHSSSFTQKRIEMAANDPHTKIIDSKLWEVKPEKYSDETFWVFAGSELLDPYIIRDVTDVNKFFESIEMDMINPDYNSIEFAVSKVPVQYQEHFVEVPVDFRKSFENELISALQDIAGVSIAPMGRLFTSRPTLNAACQRGMGKGLKHPFYKDEFEVPTNSDIKVQDFLRDGFVFKNRHKPRYVHIDQSTTTDSTGMSMVHIDDVREVDGVKKVFLNVDFMIRINPPKPPKEISIGKIRDFVFYMRDEMDVNIKKVSYDWFGCLTEGHKISTKEGIRDIEDIEVGQEVKTRDGYKEVMNKFKYEGASTVKLITKSGRSIEGTPNHKILARESWDYSKEKRDVNWAWKRLDEIEERDIVYTEMLETDVEDYVEMVGGDKRIGNGHGKIDGFKLPEYFDEELAYIIGYYLGDGRLTQDGFKFSYNKNEFKRFNKRVKDYFNYDMKLCETSTIGRDGKECIKITSSLSSRDLVRFLETNGIVGCDGLDKEIPEIVWKSPKSVMKAFAAGLIDSDGSVDKKGSNGEGRIQFTSHSEKLIYGFQNLLMLGIGIKSTISETDNTKYIDEDSLVQKCEERGYRLKTVGERSKLHDIPSWKIQENLSGIEGRNIYDRVVEIEKGEADVYDIEVEEENAYYANGFYSHNSSESRQVLSEEGIEAEHFSVDKNDEAYLTLVRLLFEERIDLYKYDPFSNELFDLIHDRTKRKVDHPPGGHNDVSDSLAGAVMGALGDDSTESSGDNDAGIVAEVNRVDSPEDMFDMEDLMGDFF